MIPSETQECLAFVDWCKLVRFRGEPLYERVVKIPNERGKRSVLTAILTALGMRKGFPDYLLLCPTREHGALFIEAKRMGESADRDQLEWEERLKRFGYYATIAAGSLQMISAVRQYMAKFARAGEWEDRVTL